jgi:DNA-binding NarL/FixJ family response regulator
VLDPGQILDRLSDRFKLLTRGKRSAPDRQQTLRSCVAWSYELCTKPERVLWRRLSVFVGGCEIDAVEGVCTDEDLPEPDLLDVLAGLVDKSILVREDDDAIVRYQILETLRDYGREKLIESGEYDGLRRRHRDWYRHLVARARTEWLSDRQRYWLARLGSARSNLRAAVEYCLTEAGEFEAALDMTVNLPWMYWNSRGSFTEGRRWLDRALRHEQAPTALLVRSLMLSSEMAFTQGDADTGARRLEDGEHLAAELQDPAALCYGAFIRGLAAVFADDLQSAMQCLEHGLTLAAEAGGNQMELRVRLLTALAAVAEGKDDHKRAMACVHEVLAITEPRGEAFLRSHVMLVYGRIAWHQRKFDEAVDHVRKALQLSRELKLDDRYATWPGLETLAWINADQSRHRRAATLLGAAHAIFTSVGSPTASNSYMIGLHERCRRQITAALGGAAFEEAFTNGHRFTTAEAVAYALEESPAAPPSPPNHETPLTRREHEVAELIAQGFSNRDIANRLVISQRTAEGHVEKILTKLGFSSRSQIAAWVTAEENRG